MSDATAPAVIPPDSRGRLLGGLGGPGLPELLPSSIAGDAIMRAMAAATEAEIARFVDRIPAVLLWPAIDSLEEPLLTHLAAMLHADWWNIAWPVAAKRDYLKWQIPLHRRKGTPWAVETAVGLVYGPATVREWWEYGGERGCFRLDVPVHGEGLDEGAVAHIEHMVAKYKRKSQHLCGISFSATTSGVSRMACVCVMEEEIHLHLYVPDETAAPDAPARYAAASVLDEEITLHPKESIA